jgi:O-methyltransferase
MASMKTRFTPIFMRIFRRLGGTFVTSAMDDVRKRVLFSQARRITRKNIAGELAEVGVYRGDFALQILTAFPKKKIYLFESFVGFSREDMEAEKQKLTKKVFENQVQMIKTIRFNASEEILLRNLQKFTDRIRLLKGRFPETTKGLDEQTFCFVSLDTDLYLPIIEGLKYFWPRLTPGGAIMVHDYSNPMYPGVKVAVNEFLADRKEIPIELPDMGGTALLLKYYE